MPFIARWPGQVPAGRVDGETVLAAVDLFPTLAALVGAELPKGVMFDGQDMRTALRGTAIPKRKAPLFWEYGRNDRWFKYPTVPGDRSPNLAVREGLWKLLVNADGTGAELYGVADDPQEQRNLAGDPVQTERVKALRAQLEFRRNQLGDRRHEGGQ